MRRRRNVGLVALVCTLAFASLGGARVGAQTSDKQRQLLNELGEATSEEQDARGQLADAQARRRQLDATLSGLNGQVAAATARLVAAQAVADRLDAEFAALQAKVAQAQTEIEKAQSDVRRSAALLYQHSESSQLLELVHSADGSGDLVEGAHYLKRVSSHRRADARRVTRMKAELEAQRGQLDQQRQAANAAREQATQEKASVDALQRQQQSARDEAAGLEQHQSALAADLKSKIESLDAELQAESDRIAAELRSSGDYEGDGTGQFIRPVNAPITSPFGYRTDPLSGATAFHAGIDFGASCGTPIKAAGNGVVVSAGFNSGGYGNMTLIKHGGGLATLYGHQSAIAVSVGQVVTAGQVIGNVGTTGKSTGCHLHWEVRVNGTPVDPMGYL